LWDKIEQTAARGKAGVVLEIDGRAVLALIGDGIEQAKELCSQAWFREELGCYRSRGNPIWDGEAKLSLRRASLREAAELEAALRSERARPLFIAPSPDQHRRFRGDQTSSSGRPCRFGLRQ
jgi:hypothetical protein